MEGMAGMGALRSWLPQPVNPKGCKTVAGGRSAAKTTGKCDQIIKHPERVQGSPEFLNTRPRTLSGCKFSFYALPVVFAALRPPATLSQPVGLPPVLARKQ